MAKNTKQQNSFWTAFEEFQAYYRIRNSQLYISPMNISGEIDSEQISLVESISNHQIEKDFIENLNQEFNSDFTYGDFDLEAGAEQLIKQKEILEQSKIFNVIFENGRSKETSKDKIIENAKNRIINNPEQYAEKTIKNIDDAAGILSSFGIRVESYYPQYTIEVKSENGKEILDEYRTEVDALDAFEFIKKNGYHLMSCTKERIDFDGAASFSIVCVLTNRDKTTEKAKAIEHNPFKLEDGIVTILTSKEDEQLLSNFIDSIEDEKENLSSYKI